MKHLQTILTVLFILFVGAVSVPLAYADPGSFSTSGSASSTADFEHAFLNFEDPTIHFGLGQGTSSLQVTVPSEHGSTTETDSFFVPEGIPIPSFICKLKVVKTVQGGTAQPGDFQIHVLRNGHDIDGSPRPGSASGTWYETPQAGQYAVSESGPPGYTAQFAGDCSASGAIGLTLGSSAVCHITNIYNGNGTTTPPGGGGNGTTTPSTGSGSLSGTVVAPSATTTVGGSLSGAVIAPSGGTLSGEVVAPAGGGSLGGSVVAPSGGGSIGGSVVAPQGGGSIGGSVVTPPGGGTIGGTVIPPGSQVGGESTELPGIPNTGAADSFLTLVISALTLILGSIMLMRMRRL